MVTVGSMWLGGRDTDERLLVDIPAMPMDAQVAVGPLSKDAIEDLQITSFVFAAVARNAIASPISIARPQSDPPDRLLTVGGTEHRVELTALTLQMTRQRLAEVRAIGRALSERLRRGGEHAHLRGKYVFVADMASDGARMPKIKNVGALIEEMAAALFPELGYVGELPIPILPSGELPPTIHAKVAMRGRVIVRGYGLEVRQGPVADAAPFATASVQASVVLEELRAQLVAEIKRKDRPTNGTLLVTTGLPDPLGLACPVDWHLFRLLREHGVFIEPLDHLEKVILHHWGTDDWMVLYTNPGAAQPFPLASV